jgi:pimeloyl-ACP methyl ester carboxylesterase
MKFLKITLTILSLILLIHTYYKYSPIILTKNLKEWRKKGNYFLHERNLKIFFIDTKDYNKDILLLLHGYPSSSYDFNKIFSKLNENFRIITLDYIGIY